MNDHKLTQMLMQFRANSLFPELQSDNDKRMLRELQRYYLVRVNSKGDWVVTRKGEEALKIGVKKYIQAEKFEAELARSAPSLKKQKNILLGMIVILMSILIAIVLGSPEPILNGLVEMIAG
ncbi:hypothetical protein [Gramella sp. KN1008]|uniref:hypothetical protein n=1 Tax=Gramella sp. KN1008 TaxID=2529298 RepID=UPI00103E3E20|nr:hypothetical protein [Gramella sp. KN1008]TBW30257.1 hypothetical protein EZJ28_02325 [Gramella sp. KN1008]